MRSAIMGIALDDSGVDEAAVKMEEQRDAKNATLIPSVRTSLLRTLAGKLRTQAVASCWSRLLVLGGATTSRSLLRCSGGGGGVEVPP
ncbi:hypothetical protein GW17_00015555 [Ensete ventricosum]|nr:hypothetical protein GW17_00015555 [Ensete ventricosum]